MASTTASRHARRTRDRAVTSPTAHSTGLPPAQPTISASDNSYSTIYQAAGDINLHQRPTLPTFPVTDSEIKAVRRAWVKITPANTPLTTADQILKLLREDEPIVVISGPPGTGKTAAALRALTDFASSAPHRTQREDGSTSGTSCPTGTVPTPTCCPRTRPRLHPRRGGRNLERPARSRPTNPWTRRHAAAQGLMPHRHHRCSQLAERTRPADGPHRHHSRSPPRRPSTGTPPQRPLPGSGQDRLARQP